MTLCFIGGVKNVINVLKMDPLLLFLAYEVLSGFQGGTKVQFVPIGTNKDVYVRQALLLQVDDWLALYMAPVNTTVKGLPVKECI